MIFKVQRSCPQLFVDFLPTRPHDSHKGQNGHVLVVAGHAEMLGAGYLSSLAAFRVGCGLVTYAIPAKAFAHFDARYPEVIPAAIPDDDAKCFSKTSVEKILSLLAGKKVLVLGPGLGQSNATREFILQLLPQVQVPLVLDADGLNNIALQTELFTQCKSPGVITPHPAEMARLLGISTEEIQQKRAEFALSFAQKYRVIVVLKGAGTIIAHPEGKIFVNPTGNPGMATAGMGDVLAGCIAGLIAQGVPAWPASLAAVYCHGLAGDLALQALEARQGLLASDLLPFLPKALEHVRTNH